jgi:allophanate hydrolase
MQLGGTPVVVDYAPFAEAASLLYDGPWVAERLAGLKDFIERNPEAILPVTRSIIEGGRRHSAVDAFNGLYQLRALQQRTAEAWRRMDVLLLPTAGRAYTVDEVARDPVRLNTNLGRYTNFVNLMDLSALAVPACFQPDGLPAGVTFIAAAGRDDALLRLGERFHRSLGLTLGATGQPMPDAADKTDVAASAPAMVQLAVVGAHLAGEPLNHQLRDRDALLVRTCRTSPDYRLYALPGTTPPKPGLVRAGDAADIGLEVEVWEMTHAAFGSFVAAIPPPLGVGTVALEDGTRVKGFLCEQYATVGAVDITAFGGWRSYLAATREGSV